jgi:ATP-dependent Zn protease
MGRRAENLRKRALAISKRVKARRGKDFYIKDLMHTLGGPVAECVFFGLPFAPVRLRRATRAEIKELGCNSVYTYGNAGANGDFRIMRNALKHIDNANWKATREFYRAKVEALVRQHRTTIERVAKALLKRKTLSGAEVAKLINEKKQTST